VGGALLAALAVALTGACAVTSRGSSVHDNGLQVLLILQMTRFSLALERCVCRCKVFVSGLAV
jgi:hypothetical protein